MATLVCPHCGASIAGPELPGQTIICPMCGGLAAGSQSPPEVAAPPQGPPDVVAPPQVVVPTPRARDVEPWSTGPAEEVDGPWSVESPELAEGSRSDDSLEQEIALPFDPRAERARETPVEASRPRVAWIVAGVASFVVALAVVVVLARALRPLVGHGPVVPSQSLRLRVGQLETGSEEERLEAARAIVAMGPDALATALDRISIEDASGGKFLIVPSAVRALADTGEDAVELLCGALRSPTAKIRAAAASVLREAGPPSPNALKPLLAALDDEHQWVRWFSIEALGNFVADGETVVPRLTALVESSDAATRRRAMDSLARIGADAEPAVPLLKKAEERDADAATRWAASRAIRLIRLPELVEQSQEEASQDVRSLMRSLKSKDDEEAMQAAKALGEMGLPAKPAAAALALMLRHADKERREAAAAALGHLGLFAADFVPSLQVAAHDPEPEVRTAARKALAEIEGKRPRR